MSTNPVAGKTFRFTFTDGPMAKRTFEHTFQPDGSVRFRPVGEKSEGTVEKRYETAIVGTEVYAVSYLGSSGYTLTVVLDNRTKSLVAFSSNEKMHVMQHGTFEEGAALKSMKSETAAQHG